MRTAVASTTGMHYAGRVGGAGCPTNRSDAVKLFAEEGTATIRSLHVWPMRSSWTSHRNHRHGGH
jgi:hypothetical protein